MKKLFVFLIFIIGCSTHSLAIYEVNSNCKKAWVQLMDLKIPEAKQTIRKEISAHPDNYYAYYLEQTCDAYALIINSNINDYETFIDNFEAKREVMDDKDMDSPYYLSCKAEMLMQTAIFNILNDEKYSGLKKAFAAYKSTYKNLEAHPSFPHSLKLDGFFNIAISHIPPFIKWAVSFFGVSSDTEYGLKVLKENYEVQKDIKGLNAQSALVYILSAKINKTPEMVYEFTNSLDSDISHLFILKYFQINIAYRTAKNEEALSMMNQLDITDRPYREICFNYLNGKILHRKIDEAAEVYLLKYINTLEKDEYLKEINYKLALYYLVHNDFEKFQTYKEITLQKGNDINERDREALYDANLDYNPEINIVKARLLLEGGYHDEFLNTINCFNLKKNKTIGYELEYHYLWAKYYTRINENEKAIILFKKVIDLGEKQDYYFASEAALRLGNIYLNDKENADAKDYFKLSIKLYKSNYYEYIEDKAKKALSDIS